MRLLFSVDVAFALAIVSLFGSRVPKSFSILLTSMAFFDDMVSIIVTSFYTEIISLIPIGIVAICIVILYLMNLNNINSKSLYILIGLIVWVCLIKSGFYAAFTGIILAIFIPVSRNKKKALLGEKMEKELDTFVNFFVLPIFIYVNTLSFTSENFSTYSFIHPVTLSFIFATSIGKSMGIFGFFWLLIRLGWAEHPPQMNWANLYIVSVLCGVVTMNLFVEASTLDSIMLLNERIGILIGSSISGFLGYFFLRMTFKKF